MDKYRILSLDLSTKSGWAVVDYEGGSIKEVIAKGVLDAISQPKEFPYPLSYIEWSSMVYNAIKDTINPYIENTDYLAIEETAKGARDNMSQKILEFIHFRIANKLYITKKCNGDLPFKVRYFMTEEWRRIAGCQQNKEEKKHNAKRSRLKKKQGKSLVRDENNKIMGRITKKHVNVRRANEIFGTELILKDEDIADALVINYACHLEIEKGNL